MIFINNKYTTWYNSLINKAKDRTITGYTEKHHIIPSSLGGTNDNDNIVKLTAREHFVCHLLLTKMTTGNARYKMNFALHMLSNAKNIGEGRYIPSGRIYEIVRKEYKLALDAYWTTEQRQLTSSIKKQKQFKHKLESIESIRLFQKEEKVWTVKALETRLKNCLKSAEARKGSSWDDKRLESKFQQYVKKNKHLFSPVLALYDSGLNIRQISIKIGISWDRVKYIIDNRTRLNNI
jgi:hypothetical protein